jgi:hypothetical protein
MTATRFVLLAPLALTATLGATLAHAGDDRYTLSPAYVQECGACHTPYPPALLPKESWQRLMGGLDKHYGTDASLDAAAQKSIGDWLLAHAGSGKRARTAPPDAAGDQECLELQRLPPRRQRGRLRRRPRQHPALRPGHDAKERSR